MRVISWNLRRAPSDSEVWKILEELDGDILLLQEVGGIPNTILSTYDSLLAKPRTKNGHEQKFQTAVLSKTPLLSNLNLQSNTDWVNKEFLFFSGNILGCTTMLTSGQSVNLISVYSPAWHVPDSRLDGVDYASVKLENNPKIYCTEILWALLKDSLSKNSGSWIVAGDFNSSTTFDWMWGGKPRGNQEVIDRMNSLGLIDCLSSYQEHLVPTFQNSRGKKMVHQLDYVYLDEILSNKLVRSYVLDDRQIIENSISDHLPVVADLE